MSPIEIVLILIGTVIIIISCFFVEKPEGKNIKINKDTNSVDLATENIKNIRDKIDAIITEATEETVENTENHLSKISNEKIIAVNDYSNQVLEKINQNHEEVVFLYNMLNEKESEVKKLLEQMDVTKATINVKKAETVSKESNTFEESKELVQTHNKVESQLKINQIQDDLLQINREQDNQLQNNQIQNSQIQNIQLQQLQNKQTLELDAEKNIENNNKEILDLYKQGKTILDISKMLEIGQGEVKLVIDLFN